MSSTNAYLTLDRLRLAALAGLVIPALLAASCADSTPDEEPAPDAGMSAGDDSAVDAGEDGYVQDASCEAGDPGCTPVELSCDETDFCPVKGAVDPRVALTAIWGSSKDDVWAVGSSGTAIHWNGASWKAHAVGTTYTLFGIWGSGPSDLWTASSYSAAFHGTAGEDGSIVWSPLPSLPITSSNDLFPALAAVWGLSANDVWIGGGEKVTFPHTRVWRARPGDDGGIGWSLVTPCGSSFSDCPGIRAIWGSGPSDIWLVGDRGKTYHGAIAEDGGAPFAPIESQTTESLRAVWGTGAGDVWAGGDDGVIRHASGDASVWTIASSPTGEQLRGIWGSRSSDIWAVGASGTILHFDGTTWSPASAAFAVGRKPRLYGIWGSGEGDVWIVGEGIVLHRSRVGGDRP